MQLDPNGNTGCNTFLRESILCSVHYKSKRFILRRREQIHSLELRGCSGRFNSVQQQHLKRHKQQQFVFEQRCQIVPNSVMRNQQTKDPKIVSLIHNVRSHPELYDYRLPTHNEENLKDNIWESIAATCGMENAAEAKMYWKNLHYSFTVFYRNELIRLVRANYEEQDIGPIPKEIISSKEALFGNQSWGYYSDMRFIAPFRVKGIDPELDRLIELAKPIVCSDAHKEKLVAETRNLAATYRRSTPPLLEAAAAASIEAKETTTMIVPMIEPTNHTKQEILVGLDVPEIKTESLSLDDTCLRSFFDSLYRSTRSLPTSLQRRVKREMLVALNNAETDAEEMEVR